MANFGKCDRKGDMTPAHGVDRGDKDFCGGHWMEICGVFMHAVLVMRAPDMKVVLVEH